MKYCLKKTTKAAKHQHPWKWNHFEPQKMKVWLLPIMFFPLSKPLKISGSKKPSRLLFFLPTTYSRSFLRPFLLGCSFLNFAPTYCPFVWRGLVFGCYRSPQNRPDKVGWYTLQTFSDVYFREVRIHRKSQMVRCKLNRSTINISHQSSKYPKNTHLRRFLIILLMEEILHHLRCIKPGK